MNNFAQKIAKFTNSRYMRILTNGFMGIAALSICGSIFSLLMSLPIPAYQTFITNTGIRTLLGIPVAVCSDVMSVFVALSMGYQVGKEFNTKNPFATAMVGLGSFLVLTPFEAQNVVVDASGNYSVEIIADALGTGTRGALGASGIFLALLAGILGSRLYLYFISKNWKINLPDSVPENVSGMFEMMIPGGLTFLVFLLFRWAVSLTPFATAQKLIYGILQAHLMKVGGGFAGALVFLTVEKLLWCFGVHGGMVAYSAMASVIAVANAANASAQAAATAVPYPEWAMLNQLMDFPVLPLAICMLIFAKSDQYKALSKISLPTSIFNISEPQVFGVPMIMNPILDIPFVLLQPVNLLLTMGVMKLGLVAAPTGAQVATVMPTPIAFALETGHVSGFIWGIVLLAIDILVWIPFFKAADKRIYDQEQQAKTAEEAAKGE